MEIIIGKESGFCFGVTNAVEGVKKECEINKKINCLGELVHNEEVIEELTNIGVRFVSSIDEVEDGDILAIRAHGIEEKIYEQAQNKRLRLKDYTCPKVINIHNKIKEAEKNGRTVILVGKKDHPETIGSRSYAKDLYVIESIEEIDSLPELDKVFVIVQTTFSYSKYKEIEEKIKEKYSDVECFNSICASTKNRQEECRQIAQKVELMIIIGGKNSSNTKKLYEVALSECENCMIIQNEKDLDIQEVKKYDIIGIMSGASTPMSTLEKVVEKIKELN